MELAALFAEHLQQRLAGLAEDLADSGLSALVVSSGAAHRYYADDQEPPFHSHPHFRHWCPLEGPQHLLLLRPEAGRPRLVRQLPDSYWHEAAPAPAAWWGDRFEIVDASTPDGVWAALGRPERAAFLGEPTQRAEAAGLTTVPERLAARLDWRRALKSRYEVRRVEQATALAARGHRAAREAFARGASELEIHHAYVVAAGVTDAELPYPSIVALDEKGAVLHYQNKRRQGSGRVLLIDAGAACHGYACDITRTHLGRGVDPRFTALRDGVERFQQRLCAAVRPGLPFIELHHSAHLALAELLRETRLLRAEPEQAVERGWTRAFFPHGLGHQLGIQVHDVGGQLADRDGRVGAAPEPHTNLRNTRTLEAGQLVTIEPGLYFIASLLEPLRGGSDADRFEWDAIDALTPLGGIRIEDDVLVTRDGSRNLTREALEQRAAA